MYVLVHSLHLGTNLQKYQTLISPSHAPPMPWNVFMCHTYVQVSLQADLYVSIYGIAMVVIVKLHLQALSPPSSNLFILLVLFFSFLPPIRENGQIEDWIVCEYKLT